ncbi:MAG: cytochrome c oxidase assembly protein [Ancalomicrobiaceae bacterium]|nr:cytochrome c oxidase assembly protein [Ancalomicrobiaceae bacterium]
MRFPGIKSAEMQRHLVVAAGAGVLALATLGLSFAAVPFYTWFCKTTGYGGTTQVAVSAPVRQIDRTFEIRFDANLSPGLPWRFHPDQPTITVHGGEVATVNFHLENLSDRPTAGQAVYNVAPDVAGGYFNKIVCFCFSEQKLAPHEVADVPVTFFVDPDIDADRDTRSLTSITLSYTFFPAGDSTRPLAAGPDNSTPKL